MSNVPNIFISNGTCYLAAGQQADDAIIPCGNDVYGPLTCCQQGDMCLSSRACYNDEFGVTYLAGCSDPDYSDDNCPDKGGFEDEPWVGLSYCNGTSEEWFACVQSRSPDTLASPDPCWCPEEPRTVAFTASSVLDDRVRLGSSLGESVIWMPGHVPTRPPSDVDDSSEDETSAAPTSSTTSTSFIPSSSLVDTETASSVSTPTETSPAADGESGQGAGLDRSARIGIGVGVGVGSAVVLLIAGLFFLMRRRRRHREARNATEKPDIDGAVQQPPPPSTPGPSELDTRAARPWSMRTELPDTPRSIAAEMESPAHSPFQEKPPDVSSARSLGTAQEKRLPPLPLAELPG